MVPCKQYTYTTQHKYIILNKFWSTRKNVNHKLLTHIKVIERNDLLRHLLNGKKKKKKKNNKKKD